MNNNFVLSNQFFLLDCLPNGAFILAEDFTVIFWNRCLENWTNIKKEEILNQNITHFFPHLSQQKYRKRIEPIFQGSPPVIFSSYLHQHLIPSLLPNNKFRIQHTVVNSFPQINNHQYYALFIIQDVTDLTQRMQDYRQLRDQALIEVKNRENAEQNLAIIAVELEARNQQLTDLYNMNQKLQKCDTIEDAQLVIFEYIKLLFPNFSVQINFYQSNKDKVQNIIWWTENEESKTYLKHPFCMLSNDIQETGKIKVYDIDKTICIPLKAKGISLGQILLRADKIEMITKVQELLAINFSEQVALNLANIIMRNNLYELSIKDSLTGLYNRGYLEDKLEQEIDRCQRYKLNLGLIMIDIDHFKKINDSFGHSAGDFVLKTIANLLNNNIRKSDSCYRYGGEEFTIILVEQNLEQTRKKAESLRKLIESQKIFYQQQYLDQITASFGIANYPQYGLTPTSLLRAGDMALYYSKEHGRNQIN